MYRHKKSPATCGHHLPNNNLDVAKMRIIFELAKFLDKKNPAKLGAGFGY
jgi:hypothetical protein